MPIRSENDKLYPGGSIRSPEWLEIRAAILKRSESYVEIHKFTAEQCECTGECGVDHYKEDFDSNWYDDHECLDCYDRCQALNHALHPITDAKVVLTIAHLDHDPTNNDPSNLKAMCQRCHNKYDAPTRRKNRVDRLNRNIGNLPLFSEVK